jgi:hypothetical protein
MQAMLNPDVCAPFSSLLAGLYPGVTTGEWLAGPVAGPQLAEAMNHNGVMQHAMISSMSPTTRCC